jgi:hypothetical protein
MISTGITAGAARSLHSKTDDTTASVSILDLMNGVMKSAIKSEKWKCFSNYRIKIAHTLSNSMNEDFWREGFEGQEDK